VFIYNPKKKGIPVVILESDHTAFIISLSIFPSTKSLVKEGARSRMLRGALSSRSARFWLAVLLGLHLSVLLFSNPLRGQHFKSFWVAGHAKNITSCVWTFTVAGVVFGVDLSSLSPGCELASSGTLLGGHCTLSPGDVLAAAAAMQVAGMGSLYSVNSSPSSVGAPREVWRNLTNESVLLTHKADLLSALLPQASTVWAALTAPGSCVTYRSGGQYSAARLILGRAMEYAARSMEAAQLSTAPYPVGPVNIFLAPVDLATFPSTENAAVCARNHVLGGIMRAGSCSNRTVLVNSRVTRDILLESNYDAIMRHILRDPQLHSAVYVSQEGHAPTGWGNFMPDLRQMDVPYTSALHMGQKCSGDASLYAQQWPAFSIRASQRRIRIATSAGQRPRNYWRTLVNSRMAECAQAAPEGAMSSLPPGTCAFLDLSDDRLPHDLRPHITMLLYGLSVFCLHPVGDTPMRRAFYDSIQMGCIPVLQDDRRPWQLGNDVTLNYSGAVLYVGGPDLDNRAFIQRLLAYSDEQIDTMQAAGRALAFGTSYREPLGATSHAEAHAEGRADATDVLLTSLARMHRDLNPCP
jgi:hypothetical protein